MHNRLSPLQLKQPSNNKCDKEMSGIYCRLNSEENVQMVTAVILLLIQSIIKLPDDGCDISTWDPEVQEVCLQFKASVPVIIALYLLLVRACCTAVIGNNNNNNNNKL